jgi:hypothetical protein
MKTLKTKLHKFSFNTDNPEDREPYYQLKTRLEAEIEAHKRGHKMHCIPSNRDFNPQAGVVEIETECLFENQWNSNVGRLFDWYEEAVFADGQERPNIKRGHWLEITEEMLTLRQNTLKCRYTGEQFFWDAKKDGIAPKFNTRKSALGSCYLKESELHLCRLFTLVDEHRSCEPLTDGEKSELLPLYIAAQLETTGAQREKQLAEIRADYDKTVANATKERDGFLWLLGHGVQIENCIFYTHTGRFGFGWRTPYTGAAREALLKAVAKFPFDYDIA